MPVLADEFQEIYRHAAQACSYMPGMQSILAAREAAQERLGERFILPDFHDAVLENGPLPIELLEDQIEFAPP